MKIIIKWKIKEYMKVKYLSLIVLALVIIGCDDDDPPPTGTSTQTTYTWTASLSYTTPDCSGTGIDGYCFPGQYISLTQQVCESTTGAAWHDIHALLSAGNSGSSVTLNDDGTASLTSDGQTQTGGWTENNGVVSLAESTGATDTMNFTRSGTSLILLYIDNSPNTFSPCSQMIFTPN